MKIPFEEWLREQQLSDEAQALLQESVNCFRANVQRAALLFAYLGLLREISYRLMIADRPTDIKERSWISIQERLRDDNSWEETIIQTLQRKEAPVFQLDENLRISLDYWRQRRNDCAHARSEEISSEHVAMLWAFIRSNIGFIHVKGGEENLREKFQRHYDRRYTPPGRSPSELVQQIRHAVNGERLTDFCTSILRLAEEQEKQLPGYEDLWLPLVNALFETDDDVLVEKACAAIRAEDNWLFRLIGNEPAKVFILNQGPQAIRHFWHQKLWEYDEHRYPIGWGGEWVLQEQLTILAAMLDQHLIPQEESPEALEYALAHACSTDSTLSFDVDATVFDQLERHGLSEAVYTHAFEYRDQERIDWLAINEDLGWWYIRRNYLDANVVHNVYQAWFVQGNYRNPPEHREAFKTFAAQVLARMPQKLQQFIKTAREADLDISQLENHLPESKDL